MLRRITLHQLRLIESLARHLNMTRAAEEMNMTPSAFSIQIKSLTESIGLALHEQTGKKLSLTEAGRAAAAASRDILQRLEALGMELSEMRGLESGELRLAMITSARYFVTKMIGDFCRAHPGIDLVMEVVNRDQMLERMAQNRDDLYIMGRVPQDMEVEAFPFIENPLVVVAAPDHPLSRERGIAAKRLENEPFILREPGSGTRQATERYFAEHEIPLRGRMTLGSDETIKQAVAAGLGLAVLSRHVLTLELATGALRELDVTGFPLMRHWYVTHLKAKKLSPAASAFLNVLKQGRS
ncbi:LysR family transcriptional regulator [Rhodoblastus acidophilus]|uniref:HTH-type transcriptional regulator CbbR n=1 Tax=Candidatus Rhodoblastus alkanivorans TaxID=2954117 RepID=A0ABS9Z7M3_9HYPH|nr:LysR family transcriptional regulator [Candidatus Rhodoblastus alkanivorans]MCI4679643.1 LysR family transcriptional regulator [Candidatus Rhodoblastus alkanivorans]MCI4683679.1 LysR family transcriptional regulator [Candidatus Rhodoblastus alkanivorans]MDI4640996.1 LysR family transcriptional regulator [Rhodoblastus acidophilus]